MELDTSTSCLANLSSDVLVNVKRVCRVQRVAEVATCSMVLYVDKVVNKVVLE